MHNSFALFLFVSLLSLAPRDLAAQSYQGTIRGRVTDPSDSPISAVRVRLTEQRTGALRSTTTGSSGEYVFNYVTPGVYQVAVAADGFRASERGNLVLETQGALTIDARLEIGDVAQVVEVNAPTPAIETANASTGQVIDQRSLVDLPNQGRNVYIVLARLSPNVVSVANPRFLRMLDNTGVSRITIAGGPLLANSFLLDGVPITDYNNRTSIIPSMEAVAEVKSRLPLTTPKWAAPRVGPLTRC